MSSSRATGLIALAGAFEPGAEQAMVVVAGNEDDVPAGERRADGAEELAGFEQRLAERAVAELDDVAEEDDPLGVDPLDGLEQPLAHRRPAQDVVPGSGAEMEVGDEDGGGHPAQIRRNSGAPGRGRITAAAG